MILELKVSQGVSLFPKLVKMMGCIIDCGDMLVHRYTAVIRLTRMKEPIHYWGVPLPDRGTWAECTSWLVWKQEYWLLLVSISSGVAAVLESSFRSRCLTASSIELTWASTRIRRLLRQHWAVFNVLRSCALVKLDKVVSCTSVWMSSRAALAVISWSTCCCRRSKVSASLLSCVFSVFFVCRRGMSVRNGVFLM